jgi:hypothetical protein
VSKPGFDTGVQWITNGSAGFEISEAKSSITLSLLSTCHAT